MSSNVNMGVGMTSMRTRMRLVAELRDLGIQDELVLSTIAEVPRHLFVEEALSSRAYENTSLPIGLGQTISQPFTVARMTELLFLAMKPHTGPTPDNCSVLEIGTGCGYQTMVLSKLFGRITSIERITQLHRSARDRLYDLRVRNVVYILGDGFKGAINTAPYDFIVAAAVSPDVPQALKDQLRVGGRLVMPKVTNNTQNIQHLIVVDRHESGFEEQVLDRVSFVPRKAGIV